jgi:hypothetical protein
VGPGASSAGPRDSRSPPPAGSWRAFVWKQTPERPPGRIEAGQVKLTIDTDSLFSDSERLTGHLKSPDFFDVAKFPQATFSSSQIKASEGGGYEVTGDLTLHGVTRQVSFPATIEAGSAAVKAKAEFSINRKDFGIVYPGKPDDLIRDAVVISLEVNAPAAPANQPQSSSRAKRLSVTMLFCEACGTKS